jgi:uncharacterized membrane protein
MISCMSDAEPLFLKVLIISLALLGVGISSYIRFKKTKKHPLICLLNTDCNAVINSKYSKFLGIPVELLGLAYYSFFTVAYTYILFSPAFTNRIEFILGALAFLGAGFSIYLISLQAMVIKEWCMWCLASFAAALSIFILFVLI